MAITGVRGALFGLFGDENEGLITVGEGGLFEMSDFEAGFVENGDDGVELVAIPIFGETGGVDVATTFGVTGVGEYEEEFAVFGQGNGDFLE